MKTNNIYTLIKGGSLLTFGSLAALLEKKGDLLQLKESSLYENFSRKKKIKYKGEGFIIVKTTLLQKART